MLGSGIAMWQICCTASCRIVVSSSVGGAVQHVSVRVVEFGLYCLRSLRHSSVINNATQLFISVSVGLFRTEIFERAKITR